MRVDKLWYDFCRFSEKDREFCTRKYEEFSRKTFQSLPEESEFLIGKSSEARNQMLIEDENREDFPRITDTRLQSPIIMRAEILAEEENGFLVHKIESL